MQRNVLYLDWLGVTMVKVTWNCGCRYVLLSLWPEDTFGADTQLSCEISCIQIVAYTLLRLATRLRTSMGYNLVYLYGMCPATWPVRWYTRHCASS